MKRVFALILAVGLLAISSAAFAQRDTLNLITFLDTGNFNPLFSANSLIQRLTWDSLFRVDGDTGLATSGLGLTSWDVSEDGTVYTFYIDEAATWSDGVPLTSADIQYTLDAMTSPEVETWMASFFPPDLFTGFEVVDDKTFTVTITDLNCNLINSLFWFVPLPAHVYGPDPAGVNEHPANAGGAGFVSSGPYTVVEYQADEYVRLAANPYYRGGVPQIPNIIMRFEGDATVSNLMLETGEIDFMRMTAAQFDQLADPEQFVYYPVPNQFATSLMLNPMDPANPSAAYDEDGNVLEQAVHPVLGDVRVRQAIALGYDKSLILQSIREEGAGELMTWMFHPLLTGWANNPELSPTPFDPEAAAALLDEAGWTDADGNGVRECNGCETAEDSTPLAFTISYAPIYAEYANYAVIVQDQLGQLGFEVSINQLEYNALSTEYMRPQAFDAIVLSFGGFPADPSSLANSFLLSTNDIPGLGSNYISVVDEEIDALLAEGLSVPSCSIEERAPIYHRIQEIGLENMYFGDWGFITNDYLVVSRNIEGFVPTPLGGEGSEYNFIQQWTFAGN